jgi:lipoprotein signal peptidase
VEIAARTRSARIPPAGRRWIVPALMGVVVVLDQTTKWWAWRHLREAVINPGCNWLVGATVDRWYLLPVPGGVLDGLGVGAVLGGAALLARRRPSLPLLAPAALLDGGWASNLLDRLVLHHLTAPGSDRGVVDFLPLGVYFYNLADVFITVMTAVLLVTLGYRIRPRRRHRAEAPEPSRRSTEPDSSRPRHSPVTTGRLPSD